MPLPLAFPFRVACHPPRLQLRMAEKSKMRPIHRDEDSALENISTKQKESKVVCSALLTLT